MINIGTITGGSIVVTTPTPTRVTYWNGESRDFDIEGTLGSGDLSYSNPRGAQKRELVKRDGPEPTNLKSVRVGSKVTTLAADCADEEWMYLTELVIPATVVNVLMDNENQQGVFLQCRNLMSVVIEGGVTSLPEGIFNGCTLLTNIVLPEGLTAIPEGAFSECPSLATVTLPNSLTSIGDGAFYISGRMGSDNNMPSITIPSNVTSIGQSAFDNRGHLTEVTFEGKTKAQVQSMTNYPWGLGSYYEHTSGDIPHNVQVEIHCSDGDIVLNAE